jgi:predicted nucleic acid-binding protein
MAALASPSDSSVVVVDASVLAAIVFAEARAEEGADLLRGKDLAAPGLLWYEMTDVARAKCTARPREVTTILRLLREARTLPVVLYQPDWGVLPQLALDSGLTAYDASYLALARALDVPLVTFDRQLQRAAAKVRSSRPE